MDNIKFTLRHGLSRVITDEAEPTTTINDLINNQNYKALLKHGESVDAIVNGTVQSLSTTLAQLGTDVTITLETRSNSKA